MLFLGPWETSNLSFQGSGPLQTGPWLSLPHPVLALYPGTRGLFSYLALALGRTSPLPLDYLHP